LRLATQVATQVERRIGTNRCDFARTPHGSRCGMCIVVLILGRRRLDAGQTRFRRIEQFTCEPAQLLGSMRLEVTLIRCHLAPVPPGRRVEGTRSSRPDSFNGSRPSPLDLRLEKAARPLSTNSSRSAARARMAAPAGSRHTVPLSGPVCTAPNIVGVDAPDDVDVPEWRCWLESASAPPDACQAGTGSHHWFKGGPVPG